jgi:competence protein ComEC
MRLSRERLVLLLLLLAVLVVWGWALALGPQRLVITALDVGQGDSILVQAPGGATVLIDGGGEAGQDTRGYDVGREVVLPALFARGVRKLDVLVVTHPHDDHVGGLAAVVEQLPIGMVIDPQLPADSPLYARLQERLAAKHVTVRRATEGQQLDLGGGAYLEVLNPPTPRLEGTDAEANDNSMVLRLTWRGFSMLFAADVENAGATRLAALGPSLHSTMLKVPHHGSYGTVGTGFLRTVHPDLAVISVGARNRFGHPAPELLAELKQIRSKVLRTDQEGAVTIYVEPTRWWAEGYLRGAPVRRYAGRLEE